MVKRIIICAFSLYPDQKSSEAIVNRNWVNILSRKGLSITVLSAFNNYFSFLGNYEIIKKLNLSLFLFNCSKQRVSFGRIFYSILNKIFKFFFRLKLTLHNYFWITFQSKVLSNSIKEGDVVWARILPALTIMPVLNAFNKKKFPFIVNVNDPIVSGLFDIDNLTFDEEIFLMTKDKAQAWTFPSSKLADKFSENYSLDRSRCFVIPHAMEKVNELYVRNIHRKNINFLYAGTFYKSAFTNEFKKALLIFTDLEFPLDLNFTFVLSQYDNDSITWLKTTIPKVKIEFKIERSKVLDLIKNSDCIFVVDSLIHFNLLKGKLIEAISFGTPVFAVTYENSVMDKVVKEYGGFSAYQDSQGDVLKKMKLLIASIQSEVWLQNFYSKRNIVLEKISEHSIYKSSKAVNDFAYLRFNNLENNIENSNTLRKLNWP